MLASITFSIAPSTLFAVEPIIRLSIGEHIAPDVLRSLGTNYYELFSRVGRKLELVPLPTIRSERIVERDISLDGNFARIPSFGIKHSTLLMVDEPIAIIEFAAYSSRTDIDASKLKTLSSSAYIIAYPAGFQVLTKAILNNKNQEELIETWSTLQGLKLAIAKRADIFIASKANIDHVLVNNPKLKKLLHYIGSPLNAKFHIFLKRKHEVLSGKLSSELKKMKKEGYNFFY